jgi:hypothetical protein
MPTPGRTKLATLYRSVVVEITLAEQHVGVSASVWPSPELVFRQLSIVIGIESVEVLLTARAHHPPGSWMLAHLTAVPGTAHTLTGTWSSATRCRGSAAKARAELRFCQGAVSIAVASAKDDHGVGMSVRSSVELVLGNPTVAVIIESIEVVGAARTVDDAGGRRRDTGCGR